MRKGEITRTNFGVTPVNVITGYVLSKDIENKSMEVAKNLKKSFSEP